LIKAQKNKVDLTNELLPSEFYLSQNYPNPFKDKTTIKYCLPEISKVKLTLFNSPGEKVKELFSKVQKAGTYETTFHSKDLSAGVYYYEIRAVDPKVTSRQLFIETKKMVLLKQ
jgi:hypothetical protein